MKPLPEQILTRVFVAVRRHSNKMSELIGP